MSALAPRALLGFPRCLSTPPCLIVNAQLPVCNAPLLVPDTSSLVLNSVTAPFTSHPIIIFPFLSWSSFYLPHDYDYLVQGNFVVACAYLSIVSQASSFARQPSFLVAAPSPDSLLSCLFRCRCSQASPSLSPKAVSQPWWGGQAPASQQWGHS